MATTSKTQSAAGDNKGTETKECQECQNQILKSSEDQPVEKHTPLQQSHKQTSRQIHTDADEEDGRTLASPVCYYGDFAMEDFNSYSKTSKGGGTGS